MLEDSLPTYQYKASDDNPLHTLLYFSHNGSDPVIDYVIKHPDPATSKNVYAVGLVDPHYSSVIYGEVLVQPEWTAPTLSAAELRAQNGASTVIPIIPEAFSILLYNPDQTIDVKCLQSKWTKSDSWEFEVPEHTFKTPSGSQLDQESGNNRISELTPKVLFRWKRDSKLNKDMTCYMTGRSVGGQKSKEPDITVAMFRASRHTTAVTIYEPNMARVEVEDRKGLDLILLLTAEVIKDLYLLPKQDLFNSSGGPPPVDSRRPNIPQTSRPPPAQPTEVYASGALGFSAPPPPGPLPSHMPPRDSRQQAEIDAETQRLKALVAEEERLAQNRDRRDEEEAKRIRKMLDKEEKERQRRQAEVDKETERLRKQYGFNDAGPALPPRPAFSGAPPPSNGGWYTGPTGHGLAPPTPATPPRPSSVGPGQGGSMNKLGHALGQLMGRSDGKDHKVQKKRSF
ncbi:hypothetical protein VHEMI08786 [[Torrubiella] hemipterigena]|uniref:Uncharacterized protein n=1 Tax=[Torrubiella] hemipterigena TaxID=1531966 RepID=A0A0A1TQE3_9HYPO|nr:hypothetical protein VHEMI08786 [[Torrubiella] hemipterigena]